MASAQFNVVPTSAALRTALSEELVSVANVIHQFPEMPDILGRALQFHQLLVAKKLSLVDESVVPNEVNLSLTNLSVLDDHLQVLVPGANVQVAGGGNANPQANIPIESAPTGESEVSGILLFFFFCILDLYFFPLI
ncbi:unnamed protein product [Linum tenue]|uniref:Uncharacterized protein n=1 Tax=Linum tenue TaxID=586396 RepID=A0AAV0J2K7_9ROSI|nr:unnamed protein product [Linum tenue]